jgi:hypothetical protein
MARKTSKSIFDDIINSLRDDWVERFQGTISKERVYRGRSKETIKLLEACQKIIEAVQPITVRGVCYRLFVAKLIDSMKVKNTQKISRLLVWARESGQVPWEWIVDESRQMEGDGGYADLEHYGRVIENAYRRDFWHHQAVRVIVISEKATVSGILRPVLEEYGLSFFAVHGFNSATKVHDLAEEIAGDKRQTVLLYVGDYDPSGLHMSEQDLPARLTNYGAGDFCFKRIALVERDLSTLPPFEAKKTDPRYRWFVDNHGADAWELDAMDPNELRGRVKEEIERYVDPADWQQHQKIEAAQRETTKRIAQAMAEAGAK